MLFAFLWASLLSTLLLVYLVSILLILYLGFYLSISHLAPKPFRGSNIHFFTSSDALKIHAETRKSMPQAAPDGWVVQTCLQYLIH